MIKLIAAISKNGVIGNNGDLIFRDKDDLNNFKQLTTGHNIYMGRRTWDSIGREYLPNRTSFVFTRRPLSEKDWSKPYIDFDTFLDAYHQDIYDGITKPKIDWIIGGEEIYRLTMPYAEELIISEFNEEAEGDTYFPRIDPNIWVCKYIKVFKNFKLKTYIRKDVSN